MAAWELAQISRFWFSWFFVFYTQKPPLGGHTSVSKSQNYNNHKARLVHVVTFLDPELWTKSWIDWVIVPISAGVETHMLDFKIRMVPLMESVVLRSGSCYTSQVQGRTEPLSSWEYQLTFPGNTPSLDQEKGDVHIPRDRRLAEN